MGLNKRKAGRTSRHFVFIAQGLGIRFSDACPTYSRFWIWSPAPDFSNLWQHVWGKLYRIWWCGGDHDKCFWFCSKDEKKRLAFRKGVIQKCFFGCLWRIHCRARKMEGEWRWEVESSWAVLKEERLASGKVKPDINLSDLSFVFKIGLEMWLGGRECGLLSQS